MMGMRAIGVSRVGLRAMQTRVKVPVEAIKALRQRTGAPIKAVKDALEACEGDAERAIDHLRKLGAALAARRAHRSADDGLVALRVASDGRCGALIELCSETDFVARTERFEQLAAALADSALALAQRGGDDDGDDGDGGGVGELLGAQVIGGCSGGKERLAEAATALGEKIELRRASALHVRDGCVRGYVHRASGAASGKIGVLVALRASGDDDEDGDVIGSAARRTAMHVAAARPAYARMGGVPHADEARERRVLADAAKAQGGKIKSDSVLQRIVDGRMRKWVAEMVLEEQEMLVEVDGYDGKPRSVAKSIEAEAPTAQIVDFVRFEVGNA